ncbi:MAG: NAD(P)H-hydrate dehydratase, partial [Clostridiales bacterium]|nr:NAD(P)H-hydrate dehydratase [Clostridiales bacterium]
NNELAELLNSATGRTVITPHPGEAARLLKTTAKEVNNDRIKAVQQLAELTGAVAVLKGAGTLVATPNKKTYINTTGNPGMATGGSGDVLSGVIGGLLGQGLSCLEAASVGVYIHGLAGDLAAESFGEYGLIATDIADMTALAIKQTIKT